MRKSNYDKMPATVVDGTLWKGWESIRKRLAEIHAETNGSQVWVVECYQGVHVWNGTAATTLKVKQSAGSAYAEGTVVEYTLDSDGYADCDTYVYKTNLNKGALTGFAWIAMARTAT